MTDPSSVRQAIEQKLQRLYNLVADLAHPRGDCKQNDSEDEAHDLIRELSSLLASVRPVEQEPITTYTPALWAVLTEEQRYEEYIRVRRLLSVPSTPGSPKAEP